MADVEVTQEDRDVSPLRDGIADARPTRPLWLDQRRTRFEIAVDNGPLFFDLPRVLRPEEIDDLEAFFPFIVKALRRRAQAIEAQQGQAALANSNEPGKQGK